MQRRPCFGGEEPRAPVFVGEVDRLLEEGRLFEGDVDIQERRSRERGFREQKIAARGAAANAKVIRANVEVRQAPAIACAAIASFSGGKRGFLRPGASIMWPLNNTTLRGGCGVFKAQVRSGAEPPRPVKGALLPRALSVADNNRRRLTATSRAGGRPPPAYTRSPAPPRACGRLRYKPRSCPLGPCGSGPCPSCRWS